jgi:outer membrane protein assembly factor BamB
MMIFRRAALFACLLVVASSAAFCDDATCGRYGPQQDSFTAEKLEPPLTLAWEYTTTRHNDNPAAPIVAGDTCYFASGDRVYAVDLQTGNLKWKYPMDVPLTGMVKGTPAIADDQIYFGTGDSKLYCLDAQNGTFQWFFETRGGVRCPPFIQDGILYFGSDDNSIYTIDAANGDTIWARPFTARDDFAVGIAVGAGMIVGSCMDGNMYGISASGRARWMFRLPMAPIKSSPIMTENITIMAVGNSMYGVTTRSGQSKWTIQLPSEVAATPATDGADVFVPCRDKRLYCFNVAGRQPVMNVKWTEPVDIGGTPMSSPTVADGLVYVTAAHGIVAAYSVADGTLKWRYVFVPSQQTSPGAQFTDASSSPVIANGALLVLTDDGVLHCFTKSAPDTAPPDIYNLTPANGTRMSGSPPIKLSAGVYDVGSGADFGSTIMLLDGQPVELTPDLNTSTVSYTTPVGDAKSGAVKPLKDGVHIISLTAKDYAGNQVTKEWSFIADSTLPPPRRAVKPPVGKSTKEPGTNTSGRRTWQPPSRNTGENPPGPPDLNAPGNYGGRRRGDWRRRGDSGGPPAPGG